MRISQVALQLFTIRDHFETAADMAHSFRKLKDIGYQAVQLGGLGPATEDEVAKMLVDEGLVCCSSHENSMQILDEPQTIIARLGKYNCTSLGYPYPAGVPLDTLDDIKSLAARLDAVGETYRSAGISLAYHNHTVEFRRFDGRLMLDVIYEETDPRNVMAEPDTYWVQYGGGDPERWCRKLKGRLPLLHLKDYKVTTEQRPDFAEIGRGNLDWPAIIAAAEDSGCQWFIVEQDRCDGDSLASARMSFEYIRDNLCS
jgi:sugar phosphate isomerase/epimerase